LPYLQGVLRFLVLTNTPLATFFMFCQTSSLTQGTPAELAAARNQQRAGKHIPGSGRQLKVCGMFLG